MKSIIVLSGPPGSGKETLAGHLRDKKGFQIYINSDALRNICDDLGMPHTRQYLEPLGNTLRLNVGNNVMAVAAQNFINQIEDDNAKIVVDGTRVPEDIEYLRAQNRHIYMLGISIDPYIAYQRLQNRGRPGDQQTFEEFLALFEREMGVGEGEKSNHMKIAECFGLADKVITNNGSLDDFLQEADFLVEGKLKRWAEGQASFLEKYH